MEIIFDLDGTLLDTSIGVLSSIRYAERKLNLSPISDEKVWDWYGPSNVDAYAKNYVLSYEKAVKANEFHLEYSVKNATHLAKVYPEIIETLNKLNRNGHTLHVVTLRTKKFAKTILKNFDLSAYFEHICGQTDINNFVSKDTIIKDAPFYKPDKKLLLIGDTKSDYFASEKLNIDFLGVGYGFGYKKNDGLEHFAMHSEELLCCIENYLNKEIMQANKFGVRDSWEHYMSILWLSVLDNVMLNESAKKSTLGKTDIKKAVIVEIAPGARHKIGLALADKNFCGTLYVIDPHPIGLEVITNKYKENLPNAIVIGIEKPIIKSLEDIKENVDIILGNHILDDLIISNYLSSHDFITSFNSTKMTDSYEVLMDNWQKLIANKNTLKETINKTLYDLQTTINYLKPNYLILSQYYSNTFFRNKQKIQYSDKIAISVLGQLRHLNCIDDNKLVAQFNQRLPLIDVFYKQQWYIKNLFEPKHWLMMNLIKTKNISLTTLFSFERLLKDTGL
ncbi:MAG: HAD hydrolase-like protein [Treponema sp.]|nr:HAD hydrolase-like protein [Treponema sp.]